jgi:hypothetical protein
MGEELIDRIQRWGGKLGEESDTEESKEGVRLSHSM